MLDPNNPFADLIPQAGSTPGVIMGPPKRAAVPTPDDPLTARKKQLDITKTERELAGLNPDGTPKDKPAVQDDALKSAIGGLGLDELMGAVKDARSQIGTGRATGMTGAILGHFPGTTRNDFLGTLESLKGGIIMEKLQALKEASKTGASGMGALSEREGDRLAASVAAINPNMSDEQLNKSLNVIERHVKALQLVGRGLNPSDPKVAAEHGLLPLGTEAPAGAKPEGDIGFSGKEMVGSNDLPLEKQRLWGAYLNSVRGKADPAELSATWKTLTGEDLPSAAQVAKDVNAQKGPFQSTIEYTDDAKARAAAETEVTKQDARSFGGPESDTGVMLKHGATLGLDDEASGVGRGLSYALQGKNPVAGYQLGRDAQRIRIERARGDLGGFGTALEIGGGFLSANPEAAITAASGGLRSLMGQGARQGAQVGALAGYGSGEGLADSAGKTVVGGVVGGALGAAVSGGSGALAARRLAQTGQAPELAAAAQAENVNLVRPMFDDRAAQRISALEAQPGSGPIVRQGLDQVEGQIQGRVANLGAGGNALEPGAAGGMVQRAGNRFITRSRGIASRLYDRASSLSNGAQVPPTNAVARIDTELAELNGLPNVNQGEIAFMGELRQDLTRGPLTVDTIRNLRTSLRGRIGSSNLTMTQAEARANRVIDAAAQDIEQAVPPAAANAYRRADAFYRERMVAVDDLKRKILGPRDRPMSGEDAFRQVKNMANSDGRRLSGLMRQLDGQEQSDIAATIAESLGRRSPDQPFSVDNFLTHSNKLSPSARRTIFGQAGAESIENLRTLSLALQNARSGVNRSNSARSFWQDTGKTLAGSLMLGGSAGAIGGTGTGAGVAGATIAASLAQNGVRTLSARALMSPRVSRWLAELPTVSSQLQAEAAARRLGSIVAREPALAGELQPLQRWLTQSPAASAEPQAEGQNNGQ